MSRGWLIAITERASTAAILPSSDEIHVCVNDKNNDDISRFLITSLGTYFHYTIDTLKFLTAGPESGFLHGVQGTFLQPKVMIRNLGKAKLPFQHSVTE